MVPNHIFYPVNNQAHLYSFFLTQYLICIKYIGLNLKNQKRGFFGPFDCSPWESRVISEWGKIRNVGLQQRKGVNGHQKFLFLIREHYRSMRHLRGSGGYLTLGISHHSCLPSILIPSFWRQVKICQPRVLVGWFDLD